MYGYKIEVVARERNRAVRRRLMRDRDEEDREVANYKAGKRELIAVASSCNRVG